MTLLSIIVSNKRFKLMKQHQILRDLNDLIYGRTLLSPSENSKLFITMKTSLKRLAGYVSHIAQISRLITSRLYVDCAISFLI